VWDYHVVLILRALRSEYSAGGESADTQEDNAEAWIYDYDTLLLKPCHWKGTFLCRMFLSMGHALKHDILGVDYISQTFRTDEDVPLEYRRLVLSFKRDVCAGNIYSLIINIQSLSSDSGRYLS
jgi:hypothetical protein